MLYFQKILGIRTVYFVIMSHIPISKNLSLFVKLFPYNQSLPLHTAFYSVHCALHYTLHCTLYSGQLFTAHQLDECQNFTQS